MDDVRATMDGVLGAYAARRRHCAGGSLTLVSGFERAAAPHLAIAGAANGALSR